MPSINKCLVLCALMVYTASALSHNGHIARSNTHNDIAARNAVADTHLAKKDNVVREAALKRRASNSARCKSRPKSSSSSSHKADPTPAKAVAADPPKDSSTHKKDPPKSSSAHKAAATPKKASASTGGSSADAGGNALQSFIGGVATFFFQNGNAGACGKVHSDEDFIVALFTSVYDNGKYCGKQVKITNVQSGTSQIATVADECPTCKGASSLDCSKGLADALGITTSMGEAQVKYEILS